MKQINNPYCQSLIQMLLPLKETGLTEKDYVCSVFWSLPTLKTSYI